jgi:hypothetical protein
MGWFVANVPHSGGERVRADRSVDLAHVEVGCLPAHDRRYAPVVLWRALAGPF